MSNLPNDDQALVHFLRQNRPEVPPSTPDLEEKLLSAIESSPPPHLHHNSPSRYRQLWLVPPAIAASLALVWAGNYWRENNSLTNSFVAINSISQTTAPKLNKTNSSSTNLSINDYNLSWKNNNPNHQELVNLEKFLENNWTGVVSNTSPDISVETIQNEYLDLAESKSYYSTKTTTLSATRR